MTAIVPEAVWDVARARSRPVYYTVGGLEVDEAREYLVLVGRVVAGRGLCVRMGIECQPKLAGVSGPTGLYVVTLRFVYGVCLSLYGEADVSALPGWGRRVLAKDVSSVPQLAEWIPASAKAQEAGSPGEGAL